MAVSRFLLSLCCLSKVKIISFRDNYLFFLVIHVGGQLVSDLKVLSVM